MQYLKRILVSSFFCLLLVTAKAETSAVISPQTYHIYNPARVEQYAPVKTPELSFSDKIITKELTRPTPIAADKKAFKFKLKRINFVGNTIFSQLQLVAFSRPYIGKDISFVNLQQIADAITAKYRKAGYIISRAIIPIQTIKNGEVQFQIVEGYISKVNITGNGKGATKSLEKYGQKIRRSGPLKLKELERYLLLVDDLSGVDVQAVIAPSATEFGAAEINFIIRQKKFEANIGYNNYGSYYYGREQIYPSIKINDLTHNGDSLFFYTQFPQDLSGKLRYFGTNYELPLGASGLKFNLSGSYTVTKPGADLEVLDLKGKSNSVTAKLSYPLIRSRRDSLVLSTMFNYLDTRLDYVEPLYVDHIRSFGINGTYDFIDKLLGNNRISATLTKGVQAFGASDNGSSLRSRHSGRSDFTKLNLEAVRLQYFGDRYSLLLDMIGQYSFKQSLLASEEFGFGGTQFGRAYDSSEIIGDSGLGGIAEFRIDTHPDFKLLNQIQYYGFYDIGRTWNVGNADGQQAKASLASAGVGMRVMFNKHISAEVEVNKPLTRKVQSQVKEGKSGKGFAYYFELRLSL